MNFNRNDILTAIVILCTFILTAMQLVWGPWTMRNIGMAFLRLGAVILLSYAGYNLSREGSSKRVRYWAVSGCFLIILYIALRFIF